MKTVVVTKKHQNALRFLVLIAILLLAIARSNHGTKLDSFANDEPFHIVAGTYYAKTGDYRLNPEHPPLSKLWVGLWNSDNLKLRPLKVLNDKREERKWLQEIMYFENDDHLSQQRSRWAMFSFHFVLGLLIAMLLWHIFGFCWAVVSMIWLALEPTISAHQPIVLTDLPLSFTLILAALTAAKFCYQFKWTWGIAFGVSAGMALAVKHSALPGLTGIMLLCLIFGLSPIVKKHTKVALHRVIKVFASGILALMLLWTTYGFQYNTSTNRQDTFNRPLELKIADLNMGFWKDAVSFIDRSKLFPTAYVWGFADTVRAGIEGRGSKYHLFFGDIVEGRAPVLYFPGVIVSKVPLALQCTALIGLGILIVLFIKKQRKKIATLNTQQWLAVLFVGVFILFHLIALAIGRTSYGGIRHALPLVVGLSILAGAISYLKITKIGKYAALIPTALFGITIVMTIGEKRIYEYYNEFVGGTKNAYKYFNDEGLTLGQRFYETKAFFDRPDIDATEPISAWAWYMREEWESENFNFEKDAVEDIYDDSNEEGIMKGYYLIHMENYVRWPNWNPDDIKDLKTIKRIGNINIAYGEFKDPKNWAYSMSGKVMKYVREEKQPDWDLVARRLEKVTQILHWKITSFVILGNAYVRIGKKDKAIKAYQKARENSNPNDPYQQSLITQIQLLEKTSELVQIENLRPASFE